MLNNINTESFHFVGEIPVWMGNFGVGWNPSVDFPSRERLYETFRVVPDPDAPMLAVAFLAEVEVPPTPASWKGHLEKALESLTREQGGKLLSPLESADRSPECSAVLVDLTPAYPIARALAETFFPVPVRVAAAWGEIDLRDAEMDPLDAPAFEAAAELLYRVRKEDRLLLVQGESPGLDSVLNAMILLLHRDMREWTERQCEIVRHYRKERRQEGVARELGVSQQAVSGSLV
ncbi:MAG TPA: hypothetical protein VE910_05195, partial [Dongiaceae bacterium]|nr:hypothetical protein [Dongiaceae bacterium]